MALESRRAARPPGDLGPSRGTISKVCPPSTSPGTVLLTPAYAPDRSHFRPLESPVRVDDVVKSCDEGCKTAPFVRHQTILMHHLFPHGEVPHLPSNQPAAFAASVATASLNGSTNAKIARGVEPLTSVALGEASSQWSLPWVQKLSSIRRGERRE